MANDSTIKFFSIHRLELLSKHIEWNDLITFLNSKWAAEKKQKMKGLLALSLSFLRFYSHTIKFWVTKNLASSLPLLHILHLIISMVLFFKQCYLRFRLSLLIKFIFASGILLQTFLHIRWDLLCLLCFFS